MPPHAAGPRAVFRQRAFRALWVAQLVSVFGDFLALFGVISLITFRLQGSPADVAGVTAAYMAPLVIVAPLAGVLVDRWRVKRVLIASDLVRAGIAASLVLVRDVREIGLVLAALGLFSSFFGPAQSVALRTLLPPEQLLAANAMLSQTFYAVRILSPAIAGALVAWLTEEACFWLDAGSFVFSAATIATVAIARPVAARVLSARSLASDFAEGNRFIFTHRSLSFAFLASAAAMFMLSSFSPLVSIYIRDTLHAGSMTYGAISSMVGVGLVAGTAVVHRAAKDRPIAAVIVGGLFLLGGGAALLGALRFTASAAASTFLIGFAISLVVVPAQTLSQRVTPPAMLGRVSSTFLALFSLSQVVGLLLSGVLASWLGIRQLFVACAVILAAVAAVAWLFFRPRDVGGRREAAAPPA